MTLWLPPWLTFTLDWQFGTTRQVSLRLLIRPVLIDILCGLTDVIIYDYLVFSIDLNPFYADTLVHFSFNDTLMLHADWECLFFYSTLWACHSDIWVTLTSWSHVRPGLRPLCASVCQDCSIQSLMRLRMWLIFWCNVVSQFVALSPNDMPWAITPLHFNSLISRCNNRPSHVTTYSTSIESSL